MTTPNTSASSIVAKLNLLGLFGISLVLTVAFYYQLARDELPCPLCLLQRAGFVVIGMGFLFNLCMGERGTHVAMILAGSLVTGLISLRQVSLHLAPGDAGYGSTLFGLHFYTWSVIAALGVVCYVALIFVAKDMAREREVTHETSMSNVSRGVCALFVVLIAANLVSTVLECGAGQCEDNPVHYLLLTAG